MTFLFLLQPTNANTKLADTTHKSVLNRNTFPNNTVPTSHGCPLQQWTEGQSLPVQSIHERLRCNELHMLLEAAGNAMSSRPCLNFHLFGQDIQSQSLRRSLLDLQCITVHFLAQHASLYLIYLTELDVCCETKSTCPEMQWPQGPPPVRKVSTRCDWSCRSRAGQT